MHREENGTMDGCVPFSCASLHDSIGTTSEHESKRVEIFSYDKVKVNQILSFCPRYSKLVDKIGTAELFQGCCLLADISGFTTLSSKLCAEGLVGVDKLRHITNNSFAKFVDFVYSHGGDVIEFAGDALICLFLPKDILLGRTNTELAHWEKSDCCKRALRCGLEIIQCEIECTTTHVAISYGNVSLALLGHPMEKCTYVMNGKCVDILSACLDHAGASELVVTGKVFDLVGDDDAMGQQVNDVYLTERLYRYGGMPLHIYFNFFASSTQLSHSPVLPMQSDESARKSDDFNLEYFSLHSGSTHGDVAMSCVSRPVLEAIASNSLATLSELRTVTTLFMKLNTYSTRRFRYLVDLQLFFVTMQRCLDECGGLLRQFVIDDKGCVFIGLWGVPTASHAGNCSRALRCAVLMKSEAIQMNHSVSIGIATGCVYCGTVGTSYRRDYVAIGTSVNLSARLMGKAEGRILMDDTTAEKLPLDVMQHASPVENLILKGIDSSSAGYYSYTSSSVPTLAAVDVQSDKAILVPSKVRHGALKAIDIIDRSLEVSNAPLRNLLIQLLPNSEVATSTSSALRSFSEDDEMLHHPNPHYIFIVRGTSGSGKTAALNHFIRRTRSHLNARKTIADGALSPVFVTFKASDEPSPYFAIQKILNTVLQAGGHYTSEFTRACFISRYIARTYTQKYTLASVEAMLLPILRETLDLNKFIFSDEAVSIQPGLNTLTEAPDTTTLLSSLLRFTLLVCKSTLVALDNVHYMHAQSWAVVTQLCSMHCSVVFVLSICVVEAGNLDKSDDGAASTHLDMHCQKSVREYSLQTSTRETSVTDASRNLNDGDTPTTIPIKNYQEYHTFLKAAGGVHLKELELEPLSQSDIARLISREVPDKGTEGMSDDALRSIAQISQGNPFLLWKIIQFAKESEQPDLNSVVQSILDNSLIIFMMNGLSEKYRLILKVASVVGEKFQREVLEEVVARNVRSFVASACAKFVRRGLLVDLDNGSFFSFMSPLVRKFVYDLVPKSDANQLHGNIARAIFYINRRRLSKQIFSSHSEHSALAFHYSYRAAEELLRQKKFEVILPYVEAASRHIQTPFNRNQLQRLIRNIMAAIDACINSESRVEVTLLAVVLDKLRELRAVIHKPLLSNLWEALTLWSPFGKSSKICADTDQ